MAGYRSNGARPRRAFWERTTIIIERSTTVARNTPAVTDDDRVRLLNNPMAMCTLRVLADHRRAMTVTDLTVAVTRHMRNIGMLTGSDRFQCAYRVVIDHLRAAGYLVAPVNGRAIAVLTRRGWSAAMTGTLTGEGRKAGVVKLPPTVPARARNHHVRGDHPTHRRTSV